MPAWKRLSPVLLASVLVLAVPSAAAGKAKGFEFGVAAGDVTESSALLWAKAKKAGKVEIQLSSKGGLGKCDVKSAPGKLTVKAKGANDNTVQKKVKKLKPGTTYKYRFCKDDGSRSDKGKFTTAPKAKANEKITFALSGDQDALPQGGDAYAESGPYWNDFEIWKRIKSENNDFNVLMGDTIYSDTEVPGYGLADVATTVEQKREKYQINLAQKKWAKARGAAAYYAHWDDHEFINDFSTFEDSFPLSVGTVNIDGEELYERGVKAFREYNPVTYSDKNGIYRSARWGKNLEVFFLDERSFRSASADYQGVCDNGGSPDLAPTAPQATRNLFSFIVPSLANPVPPACTAAINDPNRTMLGLRQYDRFINEVSSSTAAFKVIFNEVPIQQYYALPYDRWEGYEAERQRLLTDLQAVKNVVFMTTDVHANLVNDARFKTLEPGGPVDSGILDVTTGPIATANYSLEISDATDSPGAGALIQSIFLKGQPPTGVGMQCAATDQYSYAQAEVTKDQLTIKLRDINGNPVLDTGDVNAGGPPCADVVIPRE